VPVSPTVFNVQDVGLPCDVSNLTVILFVTAAMLFILGYVNVSMQFDKELPVALAIQYL